MKALVWLTWHMDEKHGSWRRNRRGTFKLLRTNASKSCWEFYRQSCWQLYKFRRWLELKVNCYVTVMLDPKICNILGTYWEYHTTVLNTVWWPTLWKEQGTVEELSFAGMVRYTRVYRPTRHSIGHFGDGTKVLLDWQQWWWDVHRWIRDLTSTKHVVHS